MATFTIRQKTEPSNHKVNVDINKRAKKHKNLLKISIIFNIMLILVVVYLSFAHKL